MDRPRFPTPETAQTIEEYRGRDLSCRVNLSPEHPAVLSFRCARSNLGVTVLVPNADLVGLRDMLTVALENAAAKAGAHG